MSTLFVILLFFGIAVLAILFLKSKLSKSHIPEESASDDFPYQAQDAFLTPAERSFFGVLEQVVGDSCRVFAKVRISDLLAVKKGLESRDRVSAQNKINSKHVDFVLCDIDRVSILAAIELDDKSHGAKKRQDRDFFVDEAFRAAGVPLLRMPAQKGYSLSEIKSLVSATVGLEKLITETSVAETSVAETPVAETPVAETPVTETPVTETPVTETPVTETPVTETPVTDAIAPICSACESKMVKRQAKKGKHAGSYFWACSAYPKCKQIISI